MSSEKRLGQALIMEGGIQSAGEALAGQDARILWISVTRTGGMFLKRGPKWGGSEKTGRFGMAESVAVMEDLRSLILDTKKSEKERHKLQEHLTTKTISNRLIVTHEVERSTVIMFSVAVKRSAAMPFKYAVGITPLTSKVRQC